MYEKLMVNPAGITNGIGDQVLAACPLLFVNSIPLESMD